MPSGYHISIGFRRMPGALGIQVPGAGACGPRTARIISERKRIPCGFPQKG